MLNLTVILLVFNSQSTSIVCVSDMNALAGLCCAVD